MIIASMMNSPFGGRLLVNCTSALLVGRHGFLFRRTVIGLGRRDFGGCSHVWLHGLLFQVLRDLAL
jgi:hypothetical protein